MSEIVTGEAVALELRLAKLPSRLLAAFIDLFLQLTALYLIQILGSIVLLGADPAIAVALFILIIVAVFVGYPVTMETLTRGRTVGKMAMGIRVVRDDGGPIGFRQALVRGLFAGLLEKPGLLFVGLTAVVGILTMLISTKGKRVGDLAAGTVVLQERVPASKLAYYAQMPPPLASWASTLDITGVDDSLALSVRQFLSRLPQLDDSAKAELGARLSAAVAAVTTPPPPPGTPGWAYLTAVLAERRRREQQRLAARQPRYGPPPRQSYGPVAPQGYGPPPPRYGPPRPFQPVGPGGPYRSAP
ncbi:MAG: hypothetical protein DLM59_09710, partial [Pseudonocardiales bacterium]